MPNQIRGTEWLDRAASSRYPLMPGSTATDLRGVFELPNDFLAELYLSVPADLLIRPGYVFISKVLYAASLISLYVSAEVNNTLVLLGRFDLSTLALRAQIAQTGYGQGVFDGEEQYRDLRGRVVVAGLDSLARQPQGSFDFNQQATGLDPDCVRPHIRHVAYLDVALPNGTANLRGPVRIASGNNIRLRVEVEDDEPVLYLDALDTTDLNENLECQYGASPPVRRINGLEGDARREITLGGSRCLEVAAAAAQVQLRNRCSEPCATCEEAEAMKSLIDPFAQQIPTLTNLVNRLELMMTQMQGTIDSSQLGCGSECAPSSEPTTTSSVTTGSSTTTSNVTTQV